MKLNIKSNFKYQSKGSIGKEENILRESNRIHDGKEERCVRVFIDFQTTFHKIDRMILIIKKLKTTRTSVRIYEKTISITGDVYKRSRWYLETEKFNEM